MIDPSPDDRPPTHDAEDLLLQFVTERDATCPLCGYNVRNLTRPVCPECRQRLELRVGVAEIKIGWYLATLIPCAFSGILAVLLTAMMIVASVLGGVPPWFVYAMLVFGWLSGLIGVLLIENRLRFLKQARSAQRTWAMLMWTIHILVFLFLLAMIVRPFI